jgi:hypothetical protein
MPKIPIIGPVEFRDGSDAGAPAGGPDALSPEQDDALRALQDRTAHVDRALAVSQAWRAGVERLSEAEQTPGGPPVGFTRGFLDDLDRERQQLVTSSPPDGREPLEHDLLDLRSDFLDRAAQAEASGMALRRRTGLYDALGDYGAGVTQDPGLFDQAVGRMDSLISGLGLPEDRQRPMRTYVRTALGNAAIDGLMQDPARAERVLSDGLYDDVMPEPVKALRLKEAQDKVTRDAHLSRERVLADLAAQAQDGMASDEAILEAERKQALSPADSAYLRQANARAAEAVAIRDARIRRVASATERLDASNPEDRAAGSDYWDSVAEIYRSDDLKAQQENERRFVERIGVLPKALENKYQCALLSKDPAAVVQGAPAIAHLASLNSALVDGIATDEVQRARAIADYAALGVEPDRAVELGDEKVATEIAGQADAIGPGEAQVAANDEPSAMSDAMEIGVSGRGETVAPEVGGTIGEDENTPTASEHVSDQTEGTAEDSEFYGGSIDGTTEVPGNTDADRFPAVGEGEVPDEAPPLSRFTATMLNERLAAEQLISPDTGRYEKLGPAIMTDSGNAYFDASGKAVYFDPNQHVLLYDVGRAELSIYRRSPETDENRIVALGRLLSSMIGIDSTGASVGPVARTVQSLAKGERGAATTLGSGVGPVVPAARTISGATKGEAWAVEEATRGIGEGAGQIHKVVKPGKTTYAAEETALFMSHKEPLAADVLKTGRPLGLADDATFTAFKKILRDEGATLPPDTRFAIRGSAVTGNGFDQTAPAFTKPYFDVGRTSDHDIAIVSRTLFEKAQANGVALRQGGTRTDVLRKKKDITDLGLADLLRRVRELTGRKNTALMIYKSVDALNARGANMQFDLK